jgi:hypothetical protein
MISSLSMSISDVRGRTGMLLYARNAGNRYDES